MVGVLPNSLYDFLKVELSILREYEDSEILMEVLCFGFGMDCVGGKK